MKRIILFEDAHAVDLAPLTGLLPVQALAFGGSTIARRWSAYLEAKPVAFPARPSALACWRDAPTLASIDGAADVLAVNAAALPDSALVRRLTSARPGVTLIADDRVVAAVAPAATLMPLAGGAGFAEALAAMGARAETIEVRWLARPWDFVTENPAALIEDLRGPFVIEGNVHPSAVIENADAVAVARGARVEALAVIDAREGPVVVEADAVVASHTLVRGPCVVGRGTHLLGGLVGRSTIGPDCRIAGEAEDTIWQGRGNKRHHGFVGHAVLGEWVNLGALTTTSDLKNTYGRVRVRMPGREEDSGARKLGAMVGAHVKTGIGTLLPTGAWVGAGANLFGGGRFVPGCTPSFGWWNGDTMVEHRLEDFLKTALIAMSRRGVALGTAEEAALREHFASTASERALPGCA